MPWYDVVIKGGKGVGKSSLVRRFLLGEFSEDYHGGSQMFWEKASLACVDNYYKHGLIVWDGDPQTVNPPDIELDGGVIGGAVVVVYDITNPSSFDEAKHRVKEYWRYRGVYPSGSCYVVGLVGSKADLRMHRKIKYEDAQAFAQDCGIPFMEVSAFTGMNVDNLFSKIGLMVQSRVLWEHNVPDILGVYLDTIALGDKLNARNRLAKVKEIDLSYEGMDIPLGSFSVGEPSLALRELQSLRKLDLSHSELHETPRAIGFLLSLTHLFLNDNYLSSLRPEVMRFLVNLQELDLRNNKLNDFSLDITELSCLQRLSLQGNPLKNDETKKLMKLAHKTWIGIDIAGECKIIW